LEVTVLRESDPQITVWELLPEELKRLPAELARVDVYLDNERFIAPFRALFDRRLGRPSVPVAPCCGFVFEAPLPAWLREPVPRGQRLDRLAVLLHSTGTVPCRIRPPWSPVADRTHDQVHGRIEHRTLKVMHRTLKVVTVGHLGFPHAAQVLKVTRTRTVDAPHAPTRRWRRQTVTVYAITSLPFELARPARLADLPRGHWQIEAVHHLRDVTFCEDASQVRTGAAPHVMATLRNLWPSARSARLGRSTSPPRCATTPATHADRSPPSGSHSDERTSRENAGSLGSGTTGNTAR
jgi:hypothetical protein